MTTHRPFVLIADLEGPISIQRPLHIDGILYDVLFKRSGEASLSGSLDCIAHRDGIPCASAGLLVYESLGGVSRSNMKRLKGIKLALEGELITYDPGPRGVKTRSIGEMSDYRMEMPTYPLLTGATQIWWQILGDPEIVLDLAGDIDGLGRLRQHGYGGVRRWHTLDSAADPDRAGHLTASGQVIRRLRTTTLSSVYDMAVPDGLAVENARPVAPYWMKDGATEVVEPELDDLIMHIDRAEMIFEAD